MEYTAAHVKNPVTRLLICTDKISNANHIPPALWREAGQAAGVGGSCCGIRIGLCGVRGYGGMGAWGYAETVIRSEEGAGKRTTADRAVRSRLTDCRVLSFWIFASVGLLDGTIM